MKKENVMKKFNLLTMIVILMAFMIMPFASAECTFTSGYNSSNYGGVTGSSTNSTAFSSIQYYTGYTNMTPQANFTASVNGTLTGQVSTGTRAVTWLTPLNMSTSFQLFNGTRNSSNLVAASNYSLTQSGSTWNVTFLDSRYNGTTLNYNFTRTFVKTNDDFLANPAALYTGATAANFVTTAGGTDYGVSATFTLNNASLGSYVSGQNFNMTWGYTQRSCVDTGACSNATNSVLYNLLVGMFMIGMLVFFGFMLWQNPSPQMIIYGIVGGLVLLVGLAIVNGLVSNICAL